MMVTKGIKATITIVDDHPIFTESLKFLLSTYKNYEVIGSFTNGLDFLKFLESNKPEIVLIDINMPQMNGEEAIKLALKRYEDLKIIALTLEDDRETVERVLISGVKGFVSKSSGQKELVDAIEQVRNGGIYFSQNDFAMLLNSIKKPTAAKVADELHITEREKEILTLLCEGKTSKEIAQILLINYRTVESHKAKIMEKVGVNNSVSLIVFAFRNNLI